MTDNPKLSFPPQYIYPTHVIFGLFLITLSIVYMIYRFDADNKNSDILDKFNTAVYIILAIIGLFVSAYHFHLFARYKWPDKVG